MAFCALDRIHYNTHLPEVQRFTQKYFLKRTLIRGKYNAVACGYNKINHKKVVIKAVYQPEPRKFREVAILKKLQHIPGVIINPNNILIDVRTNQIKVANFNSASQFDSEEFTSQLSNEIAPPEYFLSKKYTADGLYAWSLGLILYELLFNIKPFNLPIDVINSPLAIPPHKQTLSLDVITFLNWLLAKSDRITLNQIAHHPWITKQWI